MINILAEAIKIPTTQDINEQNMPKLHALIEKSFPNVHKQMEKTLVGNSLLYKIEGEGNPIMFCGHMDVVPVIEKDWKYPPFGAVNDGEFLWGRGALDCKNVVIGVLSAMESLLAEGFKPTRTIYLAFGHDEEIGGPCGAYNIVKMLEEQGVRLDLVLDEGGGVTEDFLPDRNYATIGLSEKGILRIKLIAYDAGGHAAFLVKKTALYRLAKAIIAIEENTMSSEIIPLVQKYIDTLGADYPELVEDYINKPQYLPSVKTTIAPTMISASKAPNILPNEPALVCDVRMLPTQTVEDVINHVENLVKDLDITIEILEQPKAVGRATDFNADFYKKVESLIKEKFDDAIVVPTLMAGATDARQYEAICDVVLRFAPFNKKRDLGRTVHAANERIPVESFNYGVEFYKEFIRRNG